MLAKSFPINIKKKS